MNVACTACPAKYAVPDDRVRGKRARITCKHCGTAIIVDGTHLGPSDMSGAHRPSDLSGAHGGVGRPVRKTMMGLSAPLHSLPAEAPTNAGTSTAPNGEVSYRVALATGQQLLTVPRIAELYTAGTITNTTYIWREGMPEWKTLPAIPELASALSGAGVVPQAPGYEPPEEETRVSVPYQELARQEAARAEAARQAAAQAAAAEAAHKKPAAREEEPFSLPREANGLPSLPPPGGMRRSTPMPGTGTTSTSVSVASALLRQQASARPARKTLPPREMLMSLGDVAVPIAGTGFPRPSSPINAAPVPVVRASAPPAAALPPSAPPAPLPPPSASIAPARPIEFDTPPRSAQPVAVPMTFGAPPKQRTGTLMLLSAAIALTLGAGAFAFFRQGSAPPAAPSAAPVTAPPPVQAAPQPAPTAAPSAASSAAPSTPTEAPSPVAAHGPTVARIRSSEPATRARSRIRSTESAPSDNSESPSEPTAAAPEPNPLDKPPAKEPDATPDIAAPPSDPPFDRAAASQALGEAASNASSCREPGGPSGSGQATVTFSPTGKVTAVSVSGDFAGTGAGACIVRLFKAANIPAFAGDTMTVSKRFNVE